MPNKGLSGQLQVISACFSNLKGAEKTRPRVICRRFSLSTNPCATKATVPPLGIFLHHSLVSPSKQTS